MRKEGEKYINLVSKFCWKNYVQCAGVRIGEENFKNKLKNIVWIYGLRSLGSVYSPLARL